MVALDTLDGVVPCIEVARDLDLGRRDYRPGLDCLPLLMDYYLAGVQRQVSAAMATVHGGLYLGVSRQTLGVS